MNKLKYSEAFVNVDNSERMNMLRDYIVDSFGGGNTTQRMLFAKCFVDNFDDELSLVIDGKVVAAMTLTGSFKLPAGSRLTVPRGVLQRTLPGSLVYVDHRAHLDFVGHLSVEFKRPGTVSARLVVTRDDVCEEFTINVVADPRALAVAFTGTTTARGKLLYALSMLDRSPHRYMFEADHVREFTGFDWLTASVTVDGVDYEAVITPHDDLIVAKVDGCKTALVNTNVEEPLRSIASHVVRVQSCEVVEFLGASIIVEDTNGDDDHGRPVDRLTDQTPYADAEYLMFADRLFLKRDGSWVRLITDADDSPFVKNVFAKIKQRQATLDVIS